MVARLDYAQNHHARAMVVNGSRNSTPRVSGPPPIVALVCDSRLRYFNVAFVDACRMGRSLAGDCVVSALSLIQLVTGEPTSNTLAFIHIIYAVRICGVSSACGLAPLIWKGVLFAINTGLRLQVFAPATAILKVLAPISTYQAVQQPAIVSTISAPHPTPEVRVSDSAKHLVAIRAAGSLSLRRLLLL